MKTERIQAFSDGVFAIIITIMVLEFKTPEGDSWHALFTLWPKFVVYLASFVYVGIYWNNHHHTFQVARKVNGSVLWANLALLFSLSLFPVATAWAGDTHFAPAPVSFYAVVAITCAATYGVLIHCLVRCDDANSPLATATRSGAKGNVSLAGYVTAAIAPAFGRIGVYVAAACLIAGGLLWLIPDRRLERIVTEASEDVQG